VYVSTNNGIECKLKGEYSHTRKPVGKSEEDEMKIFNRTLFFQVDEKGKNRGMLPFLDKLCGMTGSQLQRWFTIEKTGLFFPPGLRSSLTLFL